MNYIDTNIKYIRELKGFSQEYFAEEIKWTRSSIAQYETKRTEPSIDKLIELSEYTKIPIDTFIKVDLRKVKDLSLIKIGSDRVLFPITINEQDEDLIDIIPQDARAGYLSGYADPEYVEQLRKIKLPFLPIGTHRAFPIKGDSMLPVKDGSYIVAKYLENIRDVQEGKTYIVLTKDDGLVYKRVYKHKKDNSVLLLFSDNKKYPSYKVKKEEVLELWEYSCSINTQEYSEHELKISSIAEMFRSLNVELASIKDLEI